MSAAVAAPVLEPQRLPGDLAMGFVVGREMLTLGLLSVTDAVARARELPLFKAGQATLALGTGALDTALLLSGSWCVACGVHALRVARAAAGAQWLWAGAVCGVAFATVKVAESAEPLRAAHDLSSDTFHMV